ncbi:TolC family protein [Fodinibius sp. Rm-B-1B1-1]|uniref:TolC family protein n=1 Tax=Fodinibius alkaliphilus TaxID=3140241 RepID=UPI00315A490E
MRKGISLIVVFVLLSFTAHAQEVQKISLQEAIDIALENSIELQQASNDLDLAKEQEFSAKANFLPSLNASLSGRQTVGQQFIESEVSFEEVTSNSISGSINTSIPIFQGFRNILTLQNSRKDVDRQKNSLERTRERVIFNAASSYLQVLLDKQLVEIAKENLEASRQQLEQVEAQVEVGSRPSVDLYDQESQVASNELELINRENALEISRTQLIRTLQLEPLETYEFATPEVDVEDVSTTELDLQSLTERALNNRKDLRSQELLIETLRNDLRQTKYDLYPSVTASAGISTSYQDLYRAVDPETNQIGPIDFGDQFFDQRISRFAGFSISIPIFNNWNQRLSVQQAQVNFKNAQLDLRDQEYAVREEVRQAYNDYRSYVKRLESSQKALRAAERSYETQKQRYEVGSSTLIELSDASARYTEAQSNLASALYNLIFQEKLLDYYIGKMDQEMTLN